MGREKQHCHHYPTTTTTTTTIYNYLQQQPQQQQSYIGVNLIQIIFPHSSEHPLKSKPANGHQPKPPINSYIPVLREVVVSSKLESNILIELDITRESPSTSKNEMFETLIFTKCRLNQSILHKHATQRKQQDTSKTSKIARAPGHPFCSSYWPFPNHCQLNLALGTEIVELE